MANARSWRARASVSLASARDSSDKVSACSRERAHAVQDIGLAHAVSKLAIQVQGALLARGSCCVIPISLLCAAEPVQRIGLAIAVAKFAVQGERLLLISRCRRVLAVRMLDNCDVAENADFFDLISQHAKAVEGPAQAGDRRGPVSGLVLHEAQESECLSF